jgi:cobyrinic acid a,c-diamide synthase
VLGYVPRVEGVALPERHLGLVTARESVVNQQAWRDFASLLAQTLDIDRLLALSELAPAGRRVGSSLPPTPARADAGPRRRRGLQFLLPDNLALLERCGVKIVRFSPLRDRQLPACQMIWLGGGYPELHAAGLAANHEMLAQLRAAHRRGVAIYAECGGLMYLGSTLEVTSGERYPMADMIPGHSRMGKRLTRFGYCEAQASSRRCWPPPASGCAAMNFTTPILPRHPAVWPAVNSATVRRFSSGRAAGRWATPSPAICMSILPSVPPCSTTGCCGKERAMTLLAWCVAWLLDVIIGDPPHWPHPVRWIGA